MKILITGGHMSPALAVIDALLQKEKNNSLLFVGRKYTDKKKHDISLEYKEVTQRHISFIHLDTGRLTWILSWHTIRQFFQIGKGFLQSWQIITKHKPDVILSFGGYIALPIAYAAWVHQIPIYTHEQTIQPGLANKLIARIAKKICVSFPETKKFFPKEKVIVSGNPLRAEIFSPHQAHPKKKAKPLIYITGGSLGSHSVNTHIIQIIQNLVKEYIIIHQTGNVTEYNDYKKAQNIRNALPQKQQNNYIIKKHIPSHEIGNILKQADLVVGRSGANTFFELIALQKPSVLIPLPWASHGEQEKHAMILKKASVAEIFYQTDESKNLLSSIHTILSRKNTMQEAFTQLQKKYIHHAETIILKTIFQKI